ncbi:antitoxin (plasmid) [Leifsonia sp. ZF2019]|nr:antitoxin [Leifsonia sp. ZF2019]UAJ81786.1 antitoxin [Leifsonia sp. ZF2019]
MQSAEGEVVVDKVLDAVEGAVNKATGGKFEQQLDDARHTIEDKLGHQTETVKKSPTVRPKR